MLGLPGSGNVMKPAHAQTIIMIHDVTLGQMSDTSCSTAVMPMLSQRSTTAD